TVTPTKIAERAYPTNYSFPLEARERDCQRSLPPLKKGVVGVFLSLGCFHFLRVRVHADPRSRSLASAIFYARRDRRRYHHRGQRHLAGVPAASLGLRQARDSAEPGDRGRAPGHQAAAV